MSVQVYDSPTNMKGWIPEKETIALTKDNVKLVQSDITFGKGTMIYEVFELEKISVTKPVQAYNEQRGRLVTSVQSVINVYCYQLYYEYPIDKKTGFFSVFAIPCISRYKKRGTILAKKIVNVNLIR